MVPIIYSFKHLKDIHLKDIINGKNSFETLDLKHLNQMKDEKLKECLLFITDNLSFKSIENIVKKGFKNLYITIILHSLVGFDKMKIYFDKLYELVKNKKIDIFYKIVSYESFSLEDSIKDFLSFIINKISVDIQHSEVNLLPLDFVEKLTNFLYIRELNFLFFNPFNETIRSFPNGYVKKNIREIFKKKIMLFRAKAEIEPVEIVNEGEYKGIFLFSNYRAGFVDSFSLLYFKVKSAFDNSIILFFLERIRNVLNFMANKLLLYYKLEKNIEEIKIIYDVSVVLELTSSIDELISIVVKKAKNVFKADVCTLMLVENDELYVKYSLGLPEAYKNIRQKIGEGVAGRVALTGKPLIINDIDKIQEKIDLEKNYKSSIVVPLKLKDGKIIGVLSVSKVSFYPFSEDDMKTLYNLANIAAVSLEKSQLYQNLNLYSEKLEESYINTIRSLAKAFEARDKYNKGHMERVLKYGLAIASEIDPQLLNDDVLKLSLLFHDIGKIEVPDFILNKPAKLTPEEYEIIKRHPEAGEEILKNVKFLSEVAQIVKQHQERWDGKGYPLGLKGEEIHLYARIVALADAFDAMTSDRVYRKSMSLEEAVEEIKRNKGTQFDPMVVDAFLRALDKGLIKIEEEVEEEVEEDIENIINLKRLREKF